MATTITERLMKSYFPDVPVAVLAGRTLVELSISGPTDPISMVFVRSTAASWAGDTLFDKLLAGASTAGRDALTDAASTRAWRPAYFAGSAILAPSSVLVDLASNQVLAHGTMRERILTGTSHKSTIAMGTNDPASYLLAMNTDDARLNSDLMVDFAARIDSLGLLGRSEPMLFTVDSVWNSSGGPEIWMKYCSPDTSVLFVGVGPQTYPRKHVGYTVNRTDATALASNVQQWFGATLGAPVGIVNDGFVLTPPEMQSLQGQFDSASWGKFIGASGKINPAYQLVYNVPNVGMSYQNVDNIIKNAGPAYLDDYWLPLLVPKSPHEFMVRVAFESLTVGSTVPVNGGGVEMINLEGPDMIGSIPISWYQNYAARAAVSGAANLDQIKAAALKLADYDGKTITFVQYNKAVFLDQDLVLKTQLHLDYKKAKEKACETDDFLNQKFSDTVTYGALNTTINGSRSTTIFYGYRDAAELDFVSLGDIVDYAGWTFSGGTPIVTSREKDGTFGPNITADNAEILIQALNSGATLTGMTLTAQLAMWGLTEADLSSRVIDYGSVKNTFVASATMGAVGGDYDFRWGSVGITGYPDVRSMDVQEGYKAVMMSKGALSSLGSHLRQLLLDDVSAKRLALLIPPLPAK